MGVNKYIDEIQALFLVTSSQVISWVGNYIDDLELLSFWPYQEKKPEHDT